MRVIDEEKNSWFLFEEEGKLLFDVNCSHSFVGYDFMMFLNEEEIALYKEQGRGYLNELANAIDYSSPISRSSTSKYKERYVYDQYSEKSLDAIDSWRGNNDSM
ncbi:hypothetical protein [Marinobacter nauticus]|uniref:hypothetical protein n=1 Tax=Marinobacter nauticus TaxID=2743 RepID=UPI001C999551|nr:hypothetical protein [Marinobacter nauticus]MBY5939227.1 hypothetical protein [Marinobacter nauticus]MBY5956421.1 hypothetical protein [Marinobacter nauticus]MBY6010212.1 hypothetical protein [Marinobacter nauticus]